jgi:hypothetical protein
VASFPARLALSPPPTFRRHATIAAMDPRRFMAMALDPGAILRARGFTVNRWQIDVLLSRDRQLLLNC